MVGPLERWTNLAAWAMLALLSTPAPIRGDEQEEDDRATLTVISDTDELQETELTGFSNPVLPEQCDEPQAWDLDCPDRCIPWPSDEMNRTPAMFGDLHTEDRVALFTRTNPPSDFVIADLPLAGGARRVKVSEHNRALPTDRVYFIYQHFHQALLLERMQAPNQAFPIEKFTLGAEKTVFNGVWSLEYRIPFTTGHDVLDPAMAPDFVLSGGEIGNASMIAKRLLYVGPRVGVSAGVGLTTPTGSDVSGRLPLHNSPLSFQVRNEAYQLLPFIAAVATDGDRAFGHVFFQMDIGLNGNQVSFADTGGNAFTTRFNEQTLLYLDASYGHWLFHPPQPCGLLTGAAALVELHYATSVQAPDEVQVFQFGRFQGSLFDDIVNLTAAVHLEFQGNTMLRFAGIFPFEGRPDRGFDAAWQVSLIHRL